jgi:hypothetical protein
MKNLRFISFAMLLMLMGGLVTVSSCKKDDDDSPSKTQTISGKKFFVTAMKIDPGVTTPTGIFTDLFPFMPDCVKDNYLTFNENGTLVSDEGATKCEPGDAQTETGTWEFMNNETQLKMTTDGESDIYNIDQLTSSVLKLSYSETDDYGEGDKLYNFIIEFQAR